MSASASASASPSTSTTTPPLPGSPLVFLSPDKLGPEKPLKPLKHRIIERIVTLAIMMALSLLLLYYVPQHPYLSFLPKWVLITSIYLAYHDKLHRSFLGCARLHQHVTTIGLWSTFLAWVLFEYVLGWNVAPYHWLAPYWLSSVLFLRADRGFAPSSWRARLVHVMYDIPAVAVICTYKLLGWPLNTLFTVIDDHVALGCMPLPYEVKHLAAAGVVGVVNLCEEYAGPVSEYQKYGIKQLRIPVVDMSCPTLQQASAAVSFIRSTCTARGDGSGSGSGSGSRVLIHCKNGMGRSAIITLCYLLACHPSISPSQGAHYLKSKRPEVALDIIQAITVREYNQLVKQTTDVREREPEPVKP